MFIFKPVARSFVGALYLFSSNTEMINQYGFKTTSASLPQTGLSDGIGAVAGGYSFIFGGSTTEYDASCGTMNRAYAYKYDGNTFSTPGFGGLYNTMIGSPADVSVCSAAIDNSTALIVGKITGVPGNRSPGGCALGLVGFQYLTNDLIAYAATFSDSNSLQTAATLSSDFYIFGIGTLGSGRIQKTTGISTTTTVLTGGGFGGFTGIRANTLGSSIFVFKDTSIFSFDGTTLSTLSATTASNTLNAGIGTLYGKIILAGGGAFGVGSTAVQYFDGSTSSVASFSLPSAKTYKVFACVPTQGGFN